MISIIFLWYYSVASLYYENVTYDIDITILYFCILLNKHKKKKVDIEDN